MQPETTKVCKKCQKDLPLSEYWCSDKKRGYLRAQCKECDKAKMRAYYAKSDGYREKCKEKAKEHREQNPEMYKYSRLKWQHQLKHNYGITAEEYEDMVKAQDNKCALCKSSEVGRTGKTGKWSAGRWNVDHCHKTGRVRGLLCHTCNVRIGAYEKLLDEVGIPAVVAYLT